MKFDPTHRITFTPVSGDAQIADVQLECDEDGGPAYTRAEWEASARADWERTNGEWTFQGQATPGGQPGYVRVSRLVGPDSAPRDDEALSPPAYR